ncbi:MAG: myo-inositol 2-dehydrogenase 2 [Steroidobacteraceae bacterium]|nr:myo-inositol 2-dehydrogenase 2 [Steroidobacteraceae bacterium]
MTAARIGLIGTGYIGRAHAIALRSVGTVFPDVEPPVLELVADTDAARAETAARELGFRRSTGDWRTLVVDPEVDVVVVCTPNHLHRDMALAAIAAGKHVSCEKPLALSAADAREMARAADTAGLCHLVGFNYAVNPLLVTARELIASGEIGEPIGFHGRYLEDYLADPGLAFTWRCERALAGAGALADLGTHLVDLAHGLLGDIARVAARLTTVIGERREPVSGRARRVENEDCAQVLVEFANGVPGVVDVSRVATGYKCGLAFDLFGTRGSLRFDQERMNELQLYRNDDRAGLRGFRTILAGPEHGDYRPFCPAPGHGLGINDLKVIESRNLLAAIERRRGDVRAPGAAPDFHEGARVQRVIDAIERSHADSAWVEVPANGGVGR